MNKGYQRILLLLATWLFSTLLPAQTRGLSGLTVGLNLNRIQEHRDWDWTGGYRKDISAGLLSISPLGNGMSLQTELLFSQRGHEITRNGVSMGTERLHTRLTYLELPCMLRLGPIGNKTFSPALLLGGYASYRLKARQRINDGGFTSIQEEVRRWDLGLTAGVSLGFPTGAGQMVLLDARYLHGLRNIHAQAENTSAPVPSWYNRGFTASCALTF